jgi:hypothetical protein
MLKALSCLDQSDFDQGWPDQRAAMMCNPVTHTQNAIEALRRASLFGCRDIFDGRIEVDLLDRAADIAAEDAGDVRNRDDHEAALVFAQPMLDARADVSKRVLSSVPWVSRTASRSRQIRDDLIER